jgi:hypothetical protein
LLCSTSKKGPAIYWCAGCEDLCGMRFVWHYCYTPVSDWDGHDLKDPTRLSIELSLYVLIIVELNSTLSNHLIKDAA